MLINRAVFSLLAAFPSLAFSWCLATPVSVEEAFNRSALVVVGVVDSEVAVNRSNGVGGVNYGIKVEKSFRGILSKTFSVFSEDSSGRFPMIHGQKYLLFIESEKVEAFRQSVYTVNSCDHSEQFASFSQVLNEVNLLAKRPAPTPSFNGTPSGAL